MVLPSLLSLSVYPLSKDEGSCALLRVTSQIQWRVVNVICHTSNVCDCAPLHQHHTSQGQGAHKAASEVCWKSGVNVKRCEISLLETENAPEPKITMVQVESKTT